MKINKFEELNAWKEARVLRKMISDITRQQKINKDYVFCNQIRSAALSIMANIAEGFESLTDNEKINFLNYARRSCGEVRSHIYSSLDDGYITKEEFDKTILQTEKTGKIISGLMSYIKNKHE